MLCVLSVSRAVNRPVTHEKCRRDTLSLSSTFNHWLPTWNDTWPSAPVPQVSLRGKLCLRTSVKRAKMLLPIRKDGRQGAWVWAKGHQLMWQVSAHRSLPSGPSGLPLPSDSVTLFHSVLCFPCPAPSANSHESNLWWSTLETSPPPQQPGSRRPGLCLISSLSTQRSTWESSGDGSWMTARDALDKPHAWRDAGSSSPASQPCRRDSDLQI